MTLKIDRFARVAPATFSSDGTIRQYADEIWRVPERVA
jgi:glucan phosphorylase